MSRWWLPVVAAGLLCTGWPLGLCGADWPQWGGRQERNMASTEKGLPDSFAPGNKRPDGSGVDPRTTRNVRWTARLGSESYGTPTVSGGRVFVGTNDYGLDDPRYQSTRGGVLKCLDEATGKLLWQLVVPALDTKHRKFRFGNMDMRKFGFDNMDLGICSSATVEGNRVYLVTNRCEVVCLDVEGMANGNDGPFMDEGRYSVAEGKPPVKPGPQDADILWLFDMIELPVQPHDAASCSVLVHGDLLYVCTSNGMEKGGDLVPLPLAPSLIVLDKHTGRLVATDDEKIGTRLFHGQWSSPCLAQVGSQTLVIFGAGDGICYAFEALERDGDCPNFRAGDCPNFRGAADVVSVTNVVAAKMGLSPLPAPAHVKKVWWFGCNPPKYKLKDGKPIDYRTGDIRRHWGNLNDGQFVGPSEIIATPVFHNNRVYVATGQDPRHGRGRGMLTCFDATGSGDISTSGKIWSYDKIERTLSTVSLADGLVYVADYAGVVHCLDADTGRCYWTHETKAPIWGSTLAADDKVYLGTEKSLWVFAAGKEKRVLSEIRLGAPSWCTPIAANGTLYVASQKYLWAVGGGGISRPK